MNIKLATKTHLPAIVDIYNAAISSRMSTADTLPVFIESKRAWFEQHSARRPLYIYEQESHIAGWASLEDFISRPGYQGTVELSIYIAPQYKHQGIGSKLLQHCINQCPQFDITSIVAYVFSHNAASIRLLEKFNFTQWGLLPGVVKMDDKLYSVSIMGLKVSA